MIDIWNITIPELTGEQERRAYIYLPDSYNDEPDKHYPVLYMFDGQNVFFDSDATYGKSWGLKDYLDYTHDELIVAAVECNQNPDNGRLREYSPFTFKDPEYGTITGVGQITMDWFVDTFKREIDNQFRTFSDREHTFIAGSSMGGLMSLYAITKYNHVFSKAAALSPSLWTSIKQVEQFIKSSRLDPNTIIYMDYGSVEMGNRSAMRKEFALVTSRLIRKRVFVNSRIIPNGTHCEASWEKQIPFFINTLLYE